MKSITVGSRMSLPPNHSKKIEAIGGEMVGTYYAPDDEAFIEARLRELINAGADLLITTGGMSVDPDDVTQVCNKETWSRGYHIRLGSSSRSNVPRGVYKYGRAKEQKNRSRRPSNFRTSGLPDFRADSYSGNPRLRHVCQDNDL